jgi:hypothetical protein
MELRDLLDLLHLLNLELLLVDGLLRDALY